jgi:SAM-dependent methyltransferase
VSARPVSYDTVPYPGHAYPQTLPDNLATIATLYGLKPAAIEHCRVLEVGCGDAANLLPMAYTMPGARFVGVDLAPGAIERGRAWAARLGLPNLTLDAMDLRDLPEEIGAFDYIIAHGLYSWVPSAVRDGLLALVARHLEPHGVAFISYNVYPGAYARRMLREMMLFHAGDIEDPDERVRQAIAFARAVGRATRDENDETAALLGRALKRLDDVHPAAFLHDDLAPVNEPVYFHELARHARNHGLQFMAEADLFEMLDQAVPDDLKPQLAALAEVDVIRREQLLDFFKGRQFRQTLLCHAGHQLDPQHAPDRVRSLWASAALTTSAPVDRSSAPVRFVTSRGSSVETTDPFAKAVLATLAERYPDRLAFDELLSQSRERAGVATGPGASGDADGGTGGGEADRLAQLLWHCCTGGMVSLHVVPAPLVREAGPKPEVSAVARLQARDQPDVSSLVHRTVRLDDDLVRRMLPFLDGTRDREALQAEWSALVDVHLAEAATGSQPLSDSARVAMLDECLAKLGKMALLVR